MPDEAAVAAPEAASDQAETPQVVTETTAPETETRPSMEEDLKAVWDKNNPPRNERGQFASTKPAEEPAVTEEPVVEDQPKTEEVEPAAPAIDAPLSWSSEHKADWAKIPPAQQTYIAQREKEAHEQISRQGQTIKAYEPIGNVIQQFTATFQRNNLHPAEGFARLLSVENRLANDPVPAILELCEAYGVDPRGLVDQPAPDGQQPAPENAEMGRLKRALADTQEQLRQLGSTFTGMRQTQEQREVATATQAIADFAKDKPHFERLRVSMGKLIQVNPEWDMARAYDAALRLDDELQAQVTAEATKAAEAKRLEEARKKAAAAKSAAATNVKSTPIGGTTPKTVDDTMREVATKIYGAF